MNKIRKYKAFQLAEDIITSCLLQSLMLHKMNDIAN